MSTKQHPNPHPADYDERKLSRYTAYRYREDGRRYTSTSYTVYGRVDKKICIGHLDPRAGGWDVRTPGTVKTKGWAKTRREAYALLLDLNGQTKEGQNRLERLNG